MDGGSFDIPSLPALPIGFSNFAIDIRGGVDHAGVPTTEGSASANAIGVANHRLGDGELTFKMTQEALEIEVAVDGEAGHFRFVGHGPAVGSAVPLGDGWQGIVEFENATLSAGQVQLVDLDGEFRGELHRSGGDTVLMLGSDSVVQNGSVVVDDTMTLTATRPLKLSGDMAHDLVWRSGHLVAANIETTPFDIRVYTAADRYAVAGDELRLRIDDDGGQVRLVSAAIDASGAALAVSGVDADIGWDSAHRLRGRVRAALVKHLGTPAFVTPLRADLALHSDDAGRLLVNGRLTDASSELSIDVAGRHDFASGDGRASAAAKRIVLPPGSTALNRLFPVLRALGDEAEGAIDFRADLGWRSGSISGTADLLVDLDRITTSEWSVDNLIGVIHFDNLFPLTTPPNQEIRIGRVDVGMPITQGRMEVQLRSNGTIAARITGLDLFGGRVDSDDFVIDPRSDDLSIVLHAAGLKIDEVLRSAEFGSMSSTGELSGDIPLQIIDGEVAITGGELRAAPGGGIITYSPSQAGAAAGAANEAMAMVLDALENFHYDDVVMTVNEGGSESMQLQLTLSGRNPDLYGGRPFIFNIHLTGPLRDILNRGLETVTLPAKTMVEMGIFDAPVR
jgi:hypothetical protein